VTVNAEKPRKGAFVVSSGDKKFIEFLDMPRPFTMLKVVDFDAAARDIIIALA
jgi:hypothetical protein